jgi:hypothetical protein
MNDQELTKLYEDLIVFVEKRLSKGFNAVEIAPIMIKLSLEMYKTVLDEEGYNDIVDYISTTRDQINKFNTFNQGLH